MAHPHFVDVGKGEGDADVDLAEIFFYAPQFAPEVAGGAINPGENVLKAHGAPVDCFEN
jgi:hypothetical protein